jgi:hypothetical protein
MVEDRVTSGRRIAQLLASEIRGHEREALGRLPVVDVRDVEGDEFGEFAYGVALDADGTGGETRLADVYVHNERALVEFRLGVAAAADAAGDAGLRFRPKAVEPPRTVVFVKDGVEAKRVLGAFRAAVGAAATDCEE